jgi:ubiquinone/menaquinone biosynthesis C-methylase UbiE
MEVLSSDMGDAAAKPFFPGAVDYDSRISTNYPASRALSAETATTWCAAVEPFVRASRLLILLDLGCGTGRFSALFAERFPVRVVGLDPSRGMLNAAAGTPKNLAYAAARGESLPLRDRSCDVVWLSHVIHHVPDPETCARELRRVIKPDGRVLIRGTFGDRTDGFATLFRFFPRAQEVAAQFPTLEQIAGYFARAGFAVESLRRVQQETCRSLREFAGRTRLRADSTLALLSDCEFERCQRALESAAEREAQPTPVVETLDFLVLRGSS